jgi:ribosomal protein S26
MFSLSTLQINHPYCVDCVIHPINAIFLYVTLLKANQHSSFVVKCGTHLFHLNWENDNKRQIPHRFPP